MPHWAQKPRIAQGDEAYSLTLAKPSNTISAMHCMANSSPPHHFLQVSQWQTVNLGLIRATLNARLPHRQLATFTSIADITFVSFFCHAHITAINSHANKHNFLLAKSREIFYCLLLFCSFA
ncbi:MAG: hypothetical protein ACI81A_002589, partial [Paraglaciecola sp.]